MSVSHARHSDGGRYFDEMLLYDSEDTVSDCHMELYGNRSPVHNVSSARGNMAGLV